MLSLPKYYIGTYFNSTLVDRILYIECKIPELTIELAKAKVDERLGLMEHLKKPIPVLYDMSSVVSIDEETIVYLATFPDAVTLISARAFLVTNQINRLIFSIWEQYEGEVPLKTFRNHQKREAIYWLKKKQLMVNN